MTKEEMQRLKKTIVLVAHYYRAEIADTVVSMYASDLSRYEFTAVIEAYEKYRQDARNKFMPIPAQIVELMNPLLSDEGTSKEVAARIIGAVTKYGWSNAADAMVSIGEIGQKVVNMIGGWRKVCDSLGVTITDGQAMRQWSDLALQLIKKAKLGIGDEPPRFAIGTKDKNVAGLIDSALKRNGDSKDEIKD